MASGFLRRMAVAGIRTDMVSYVSGIGPSFFGQNSETIAVKSNAIAAGAAIREVGSELVKGVIIFEWLSRGGRLWPSPIRGPHCKNLPQNNGSHRRARAHGFGQPMFSFLETDGFHCFGV